MDGYHGASRYMCGSSVLLGPTAMPRTPKHHPRPLVTYLEPTRAHPIVWRAHFPAEITSQLVSWGILEVQVANSYVELKVRMIHHVCMTD